jgi:hypothetical protein
MHKSKPSKHKPVLSKKRNPVVVAMLTNPKRNTGRHNLKKPAFLTLTMLDLTKEMQ